jgi:two-component system phosphate regulon sensor histidine kinase PhoR
MMTKQGEDARGPAGASLAQQEVAPSPAWPQAVARVNLASPIFRKLLGSAFLLVTVTLLVSDFFLTRYAMRRERQVVEQRLQVEAQLLTAEVTSIRAEQLEAWAQEVAARAQARVTIIDPGGVVLADSHHDPETMENHANRPEIQMAFHNQVGTSIRRSRTLDRDLCYLAVPFQHQGRPGYALRLAVPLENVDAAVAAVRRRMLFASVAAAVLALAIAYVFSRSFTRRVSLLRAYAEGLVAERFAEGRLPTGEDELGALARSLNFMAGQLRDLVERLSQESARHETILASMAEGVLAVDAEQRIIFANKSFARVMGAQIPIPEKTPLVGLIRDPSVGEMFARVLATGEACKERLQPSAAQGRIFEVQAAPLVVGTGLGAVAIFHDITDLERLERIRKDFVANVSHELRTPLTAIRGYAETLLEGALADTENNRKFVEIIRAHAIRLNNITSDLLTLSELESGKPGPAPGPVSVRGALQAALATVESEARVRDVNVICGQLEDAQVLGDRAHLEQALVNLLNNAVKFNRPSGEVKVEIIRPLPKQVNIVIADTGIGIPSTDLPRIFERFYRVDKARSREVGGTGLGLSIVKHIVERMQGSVAVESQVGKGSTFTVVLPTC